MQSINTLTPERLVHLERLWVSGKTLDDLVSLCNVPRSTLQRKLANLRPPKEDRWTPDVLEMLTQLVNAGKTGGQIAQALGPGFTRSACIARAKRMGLIFKSHIALIHRGEAQRRSKARITDNKRNRIKKPSSQRPSLAGSVEAGGTVAVHVPPVFHHINPAPVGGVTILDLERGMCRFVLEMGEPGDLPLYCGQHTECDELGHIRSFCPGHFEMVYTRDSIERAKESRRHIVKMQARRDFLCMGEAGY